MTTTTEQTERSLLVERSIDIHAPAEVVWEALLEELGPGSETMEGKSMHMKLEPWPGGRWYRDLGNNTGHFWGHVQVIKPPALLELCGPMFMSYPGVNHIQYRLTAEGDGTQLKLVHRAFGQIPQEVLDNLGQGWDHGLNRIRQLAEKRG